MKKLLCGILLAIAGFVYAQEGMTFVLCDGLGTFVQVRPDHPQMSCESENYIGPVESGSAFKEVREFPKKTEKYFAFRSVIFEDSKSLLQSDYDFVVVPNERNIYYHFRGVNIEKYIEEYTLPDLKDSSLMRRIIKKPISKAIKEYANTEWEPYLKAELEVWE